MSQKQPPCNNASRNLNPQNDNMDRVDGASSSRRTSDVVTTSTTAAEYSNSGRRTSSISTSDAPYSSSAEVVTAILTGGGSQRGGGEPMSSDTMKFGFPWKLHELLSDVEKEGKASIISWMPDGKCFKVHKREEFVKSILPTKFRQTSYRSFQRQLYGYGFVRETKGPNKGSYYNPMFLRDNKGLCAYISRGQTFTSAAQEAAHESSSVTSSVASSVGKHDGGTKINMRGRQANSNNNAEKQQEYPSSTASSSTTTSVTTIATTTQQQQQQQFVVGYHQNDAQQGDNNLVQTLPVATRARARARARAVEAENPFTSSARYLLGSSAEHHNGGTTMLGGLSSTVQVPLERGDNMTTLTRMEMIEGQGNYGATMNNNNKIAEEETSSLASTSAAGGGQSQKGNTKWDLPTQNDIDEKSVQVARSNDWKKSTIISTNDSKTKAILDVDDDIVTQHQFNNLHQALTAGNDNNAIAASQIHALFSSYESARNNSSTTTTTTNSKGTSFHPLLQQDTALTRHRTTDSSSSSSNDDWLLKLEQNFPFPPEPPPPPPPPNL